LPSVPLKTTSSILEHLRLFGDCSPRTHLIASLILLFPEPLGPTTAVIPLSKVSFVLSGDVLNPCISSDFSNIHTPHNKRLFYSHSSIRIFTSKSLRLSSSLKTGIYPFSKIYFLFTPDCPTALDTEPFATFINAFFLTTKVLPLGSVFISGAF